MEFNLRIRAPGYWDVKPRTRAIFRDADVAAQLFAVAVTMFTHGIPEQAASGAGAGSLTRDASYFGPRERLCPV
jgi:hypothetical protein